MGDLCPTTGCSSRLCLCCHSAIIRHRVLILNPDGELEGQAGLGLAGGWLGTRLGGPFGFGPHPACPPSTAVGPNRHVYTWLGGLHRALPPTVAASSGKAQSVSTASVLFFLPQRGQACVQTMNWILLVSGTCKGPCTLLSRGLHAPDEAHWAHQGKRAHTTGFKSQSCHQHMSTWISDFPSLSLFLYL